MSGASVAGTGHQRCGLQSKSDGHSTLKQNSIATSCGSKSGGGAASSAEVTRLSVYVEKSPLTAVRTTSTLAASASALTMAAVSASAGAPSCAGNGAAAAAHCTSTFLTRSPPSTRTFAALSVAGT